MEPRLSLITLGVSDLQRSLKFYRDGLGWPTTWTGDKGVVFFKNGGSALALYPYDHLAKDVGEAFTNIPRQKFNGISLAHNVRTQPEVDEVLNLAKKAGGEIVKPGQKTFWGGYSGYFSDPDGFLWEVAHGAFPINADGSLKIP